MREVLSSGWDPYLCTDEIPDRGMSFGSCKGEHHVVLVVAGKYPCNAGPHIYLAVDRRSS